MVKEFKLPDVGEGLTEADIVAWHVKPGDLVEDGQIIVEIETAKAVVELPCPWDGTVARLLAEEGQTVEVGVPIIAVEVGTSDSAERAEVAAPASAESASDDEAPEEESGAHSILVGYGVKASATTRRARRTAAGRPETAEVPTAPEEPVEPPEVPAEPGVPAARVLAKPPVRKLAKDLGISLAALAGSGPDGSITRDDVQRAAGAGTPARSAESGNGSRTATSATASGGEERIAVRGVRKHMAAAMVASAFTAPHVTEFLQVDVTETMAAVRRLRELPEFAELRVSPLLFAARALLVAVARHPLVNSSWDAAAEEIVVKHYVNLGIAVAAERGLIVPNVKHADALTLPELARALQVLTETARAGKATPADLAGGTITITNVGVFGVDAGTPILTPGETAILAFGQVKDTPWVVDGELAVRKACTLSLSFDHRIVDGELGSAVLRDVGSMLTDPLRILAWS
jgi:pyruvate dehydrogenase E2 component (dihydrolipoamide acetyltransferase)